MLDFRLYMLQRLTALIMAPLVLGHIAVMVYAIGGGLSAAEVLGRTHGSIGWMLFYGTFVFAVSIHASIGLGVVLAEHLSLRGKGLSAFCLAIFFLLASLGGRAVYGVTAW